MRPNSSVIIVVVRFAASVRVAIAPLPFHVIDVVAPPASVDDSIWPSVSYTYDVTAGPPETFRLDVRRLPLPS